MSKLSSEFAGAVTAAALALVLSGVLVSCGDDAMTPASLVIRDRVAAIRATPAEIGVGEETVLEALLVHPGPDAPDLGQIWFTCIQSEGARGCLDMDFSGGLDLPGDDDDSAAAPGPPAGVQFGFGSSFTFKAEGAEVEAAWEALTPEQQVEGLTVLVSVAFLPITNQELLEIFAGLTGGGKTEAAPEVLNDLMEEAILATRRVVISDKTGATPSPVACDVSELLPNTGPELERLRFHLDPEGRDSGIELAQLVPAAPGQSFTLRPQLSEGSIEPYLYVRNDGVTECRGEAPYFAWLSNGGTHGGDYSFTADAEDEDETPGRPKVHSFSVPPEEEFTTAVDLWLVVRDRRGGVDWAQWRFSPGSTVDGLNPEVP